MSDTTPDRQFAGWQFHANRHVTLWIDGVARHIRPPNMGEFRRVRDDVTVAHEVIAQVMLDGEERRLDLVAAVDAGDVQPADARVELAKLSVDINNQTTATHWKLLRAVIERFSGTTLADDDDLPPWLIDHAAKGLGDLAEHWRSAPPPLGAG